MPDPVLGETPPEEAIAFFRRKLSVSTERWDDLLGQAHAKAFTVAGAAKWSLREDLRGALDDAISKGESLGTFRRRFDEIVQEHGWSYKGARGWRTGVIYSTNLRTASMAGRWAQHQRVKDRRPYLQYLTAGDIRVREEHRAWDDVILPIDHTWWDTHYPPNGWGCRCTVRSLSQRQLDRMGREVSSAPPVVTEERVNDRTGEIYGDVPQGIDTGWDYHVGKAWLGPDIALGEALAELPAASRGPAIAAATRITAGERDSIANWARTALARDRALGEMRTVGWVSDTLLAAATERGARISNVAIFVDDVRLRRMRRPTKISRGAALSIDDVADLPVHLAEPEAVLWDRKSRSLVYAFTPAGRAGKVGKFILRLDVRGPDRRRLSMIRSGGIVQPGNLLDPNQYELLQGQL